MVIMTIVCFLNILHLRNLNDVFYNADIIIIRVLLLLKVYNSRDVVIYRLARIVELQY
jgi:hypothetical protein